MDLLYKKVTSGLTYQEEIIFQKWLSESEDNKKEFEEVQSLILNGSNYSKYQEINVDQAWDSIQRKSSTSTIAKTINWKKNLSIAASVILILGAGYLFLDTSSNLKDSPTMGQPGRSLAYLSVGSKHNVEITPSENIILDHVNNEAGGTLRYDLSVDKNKEPKVHTLSTQQGGEYKIVLSDGTKVWLNAESKLEYPSKFIADSRHVRLEGEAYFEVSKDPQRPFTVSTNKVDIEVIGTAFNVSAYPQDNKHNTTLIEGKIKIKDVTGQDNILARGDQHILSINNGNSEIKQVVTDYATDWVYGKYIFKNESLEDVMHQLSKWYSLDYKFVDENLKEIKYTGTAYKDKPISELLEAIAFIRPITFTEKNGLLMIQQNE